MELININMCAIEVYTLEQSVMWKDIVEKFRFCDVYYLPEYVKAFEVHGDGCPLLIRTLYVELMLLLGAISQIFPFFRSL